MVMQEPSCGQRKRPRLGPGSDSASGACLTQTQTPRRTDRRGGVCRVRIHGWTMRPQPDVLGLRAAGSENPEPREHWAGVLRGRRQQQ